MTLLPRHRYTGKDDRQVAELIGLARGLIADGHLSDGEIEYLENWLNTTVGIANNPLAADIVRRLSEVLSDGVIDDEERLDLHAALEALPGMVNWGLGELPQSTSLPLCDPPPAIRFRGSRFTFTGSFVYGSSKDCEVAVRERKGKADSSVRLDTSFLVIGQYASDEWVQSSFGRKIEKAMEYRDKRGLPIHIVSEAHWQSFL